MSERMGRPASGLRLGRARQRCKGGQGGVVEVAGVVELEALELHEAGGKLGNACGGHGAGLELGHSGVDGSGGGGPFDPLRLAGDRVPCSEKETGGVLRQDQGHGGSGGRRGGDGPKA